MKAKIVLFSLITICLLNWAKIAEAVITVGPLTFEDEAFADNATQLDEGNLFLVGGATDLNDALTGYSPTKGLINLGVGNANFFELEFTDIIAENSPGPDIVLFDLNGGHSPYEVAVRDAGGNISDFVTLSPEDFVIDTGLQGPFSSPVVGGPIDLNVFDLPPGALVYAILFKGAGNPDPSMVGVLNGRQIIGVGFQVTALAPYSVRGGNTGLVKTTVFGSDFQDGASVVLTGPGPDIIPVTVSVSKDGNTILATFDLTDKALGLWDVVVTNPDFTTSTLTEGFLIEDPVIAIGPWLFHDNAFADIVTQLDEGKIYLVGGATDLNDALAGYTPTKGLINLGNQGNANSFQLEFTDLLAQNSPGFDIVLFDLHGGKSAYSVAVRDTSGYISNFVTLSPGDFINTGLVGPFNNPVVGGPIDLDVFGIQPGAQVDAILFSGVDGPDPAMVGILNPVPDSVEISNKKLSTIQLNVESSQKLDAISGASPYSWYRINGVLPTGMSLSPDGSFSGIPTQLGSFTFTLGVIDSNGDWAEKEFTVDVTLVLPSSDIRIRKVGTVTVPGRMVSYFILVENAGRVKATDVVIEEHLFSRDYNTDVFSFESADPEPAFVEDGFAILWHIPSIGAGEIQVINYNVRLNPLIPLGTTVAGPATQGSFSLGGIRARAASGSNCDLCMEICRRAYCDHFQRCSDTAALCPLPIRGFCQLACLPLAARCAGCLNGCFRVICDRGSHCPNGYGCDLQNTVGPVDPNEKLVIAKKYIQPDQLLVYPIHFENVGDIEALDVFVTDVLNPNLDVSTLELLTPDGGSFDENTRTLKWDLLGRNLQVGETGNVLLSIRPMPNLPSGTEISNAAVIQFEVFDLFITNEVVNIIDTTLPNGVMDSLPAVTKTLDFQISWSGTDDVGEIDDYSIFVSVDGEGFKPYLERTQETSTTFSGEDGRTYEFFCVAVDTAGNIETQDTIAETGTQIVTNTKPVADAGEDVTWECTGNSNTTVTLDGSGSIDFDGDSITYEWTWSGGSFSGINPAIQLPLGATSIELVVNDGIEDSDPDTVVITVSDNTPPDIATPPDMTVEYQGGAGQPVDIDTPSASDNCCDVTLTNNAPSLFSLGETIVTWTATDCNGNSTTATQTITVKDTTPPVLGDLNGDDIVNYSDFMIFRSTLGKCDGDTGFMPEADYDSDGCITYTDYQIWYGHYRNQQ